MSVITDAVKAWKTRLAEIDQQIGPLVAEAQELRDAIASVEAGGSSRTTPTRRARASASAAPAAPRRAARRGSARAPRGHNRQVILAAIKSTAKTAGDVAAETGISRGTVATTLTKLVADGSATKAERGYKAA